MKSFKFKMVLGASAKDSLDKDIPLYQERYTTFYNQFLGWRGKQVLSRLKGDETISPITSDFFNQSILKEARQAQIQNLGKNIASDEDILALIHSLYQDSKQFKGSIRSIQSRMFSTKKREKGRGGRHPTHIIHPKGSAYWRRKKTSKTPDELWEDAKKKCEKDAQAREATNNIAEKLVEIGVFPLYGYNVEKMDASVRVISTRAASGLVEFEGKDALRKEELESRSG